jgi:AcrR family transcriptional regulator
MTTTTETESERTPLSRDRILEAAISLADEQGLDAVTMRRLGYELGVEAMSLYNHIDNKGDLMAGIVDRLIGEINAHIADIDPPRSPDDWKRAMRQRILGARSVMLEHKWAPSLIDSTATLSPAVIGYFDGLLGIFIAGGFSYDLSHHALHALGSRAIGFTQELFDESSGDGGAEIPVDVISEMFPNIGAMLEVVVHDGPEDTVGWCDDQTEFIFGLDLLLDGLDNLRREGG